MKRLVCALTAGLFALGPAHAISRYNINNMTCDRVQDIIESEGEVILRYKSRSGSGMTLYDRFVVDDDQCDDPLVGKIVGIPTADTRSCEVMVCKQDPDD
ncbi:hypothetical protein CSC94_23560 [Zhengella mangrovi]|uniref:KTSC domain-containing protein n=1 Tax=Zhengella mangrovi TaxID=1982044 RepID=A0A2G1QGL6_9HYPH|nr:hypothetical protein [Zhengella mangrovi]PHP64594.1 hypothetical protein CSC94_23560 [Zhengella mangrovi]